MSAMYPSPLCLVNVSCASCAGDFLVVSIKHKRIVQAVQATNTGLDSLLAYDRGVIIGCGDQTIKYFDSSFAYVGFTKLDGRVNSLSFSPDKLEVWIPSVVVDSCLSCCCRLLFFLFFHHFEFFSLSLLFFLSVLFDIAKLLAGTATGTISRVNIATRQNLIISESHTAGILAVAFATDNSERFATASSDGTIR